MPLRPVQVYHEDSEHCNIRYSAISTVSMSSSDILANDEQQAIFLPCDILYATHLHCIYIHTYVYTVYVCMSVHTMHVRIHVLTQQALRHTTRYREWTSDKHVHIV